MSYWYARSWYTRSLTAFVTLSFILPASAQNRPPVASPVSAASSPASLTGKERLGRKWMDEQRIDNCNVPGLTPIVGGPWPVRKSLIASVPARA